MALGKVLLHGISDFWSRFFADLPLLEAFHAGTLEAIAGEYQRLLQSILRMSYADAPLSERSPWEPLFLIKPFVIEVQGPQADEDRWVYPLGSVRDFNLLHNKVLSPTTSLEVDFDFEIIANDAARLEELNALNSRIPLKGWFIGFKQDPFNWGGAGNTIPGVPKTKQLFDMTIKLADESSAIDLSAVVAGHGVRVVHSDATVEYAEVSSVSGNVIQLTSRTYISPDGVPGGTGVVTVSVGANSPMYEDILTPFVAKASPLRVSTPVLSLWAPSVEKDYYSLYELHGHSFSNAQEDSTELYREFVKGLWNLYVEGPSLNRIEAALNIVSGYPTVRDDGELIATVNRPALGDVVVTTDSETYAFPNGTPLKPEVVAAALSVDGIIRNDLYTLLTDATLLSTANSFKNTDMLPGDTLRVTAPNAPVDFTGDRPIESVEATYLKVPNANVFPTQAPVPALTWSVIRLIDGVETVIAGGVNGTPVKNSAVAVTLEALDPLTAVYTVTDRVETADWWHHITIPAPLVPGLAVSRRTVSTELYRNFVDEPTGYPAVGDLGMMVGRNDDLTTSDSGLVLIQHIPFTNNATVSAGIVGVPTDFVSLGVEENFEVVFEGSGVQTDTRTVVEFGEYWLRIDQAVANIIDPVADMPASGETWPDLWSIRNPDTNQTIYSAGVDTATVDTMPGERHTVAYAIMDKFLKWHMFTVGIDNLGNNPAGRTKDEVISMVLAAKPTYTYPYVEPETGLSDRLGAVTEDVIQPKPGIPFTEIFANGLENQVYVGARGLVDFDDANAGVSLLNLGGVALAVGHVLRLYGVGTAGANVDVQVVAVSSHTNGASERARFTEFPPASGNLPVTAAANVRYEVWTSDGATPPAVDAKLFDSNAGSGNTGAIIGNTVGAPGFIVGGMDPLIDRHELIKNYAGQARILGVGNAIAVGKHYDNDNASPQFGTLIDNTMTIDEVAYTPELGVGQASGYNAVITDVPVTLVTAP